MNQSIALSCSSERKLEKGRGGTMERKQVFLILSVNYRRETGRI
jgi:hypothetical protein